MKEKNTNKGITLIALVITIIVMLILVSVTISMAVNGGLFDYAKKASSEFQNARDKEQQLADLAANMTVDEMIDKYTAGTKGVDLSLLNVGDYVNYPVEYTNVQTGTGLDNGQKIKHFPKDEFIGWRILSKEMDEEGNILYVKLVSTGVPLGYWHTTDSTECIQALTTNFLTTEIVSEWTDNKFCKCGFNYVVGGNLTATFTNKYTDKVQALTKDELDKVVLDFGGESTTSYGTYVNDSKYKDLLAIPCQQKGSGSCLNWIPLLSSGKLWAVSDYGYIVEPLAEERFSHSLGGVRPVVYLKSGVQFTPAAKKTNETTTWDISI